MAAWPSCVKTAHFCSISSESLLNVHSDASSTPLMMIMLNKTGTNIDYWHTLLVTGLQLDLCLWSPPSRLGSLSFPPISLLMQPIHQQLVCEALLGDYQRPCWSPGTSHKVLGKDATTNWICHRMGRSRQVCNASTKRIIFCSSCRTFTDYRWCMGLLSMMQRANGGHKFCFCESLGEMEIFMPWPGN